MIWTSVIIIIIGVFVCVFLHSFFFFYCLLWFPFICLNSMNFLCESIACMMNVWFIFGFNWQMQAIYLFFRFIQLHIMCILIILLVFIRSIIIRVTPQTFFTCTLIVYLLFFLSFYSVFKVDLFDTNMGCKKEKKFPCPHNKTVKLFRSICNSGCDLYN